MKIVWNEPSWSQYLEWQVLDKKTLRRINQLITDIIRNGQATGIGKPEPLKNELFIPKDFEFEGLFGVFADCLPDGWGRFLTDRYLQTKGISKEEINPLTRLCMLNRNSSGSLEYLPQIESDDNLHQEDFDDIFMTARNILGEISVTEEEIECLYRKGGSSGGARPKVNALIDNELWIVKFPSSFDGNDAGKKEFECNERAVDAGLDVAPFRLMKSSLTKGFFASKRFDRKKEKRIHMISLSGLLESSPMYWPISSTRKTT